MEEDDIVNTHITMDSSDVHVCGNLPLFSSIVPEKAKKVLKSKLKRSEKRASKQAHAALEALPKELDHNWENMTEEQTKDPSFELFCQKIENKDKEFQKEQGLLWRKVLMKSSKLTSACSPQSVILKLAHKFGQLGRKAQLLEHYYWPGMNRNMKTLCEGCVACQEIAVEFVGPLPRTKQGKNIF